MIDDLIASENPPAGAVSRLRRRAWPLAVTGAFVLLGMTYSLLWAPVVRHHPYWVEPGDLWSTYRAAHYVGWGDLGGVYGAGAGLVTLPGILLLLAPVAMLTGSLGLSESFPKFLVHPSAWLILGPYEMLLSAITLFACDALAERLGASRGRRAVLCVAEAVVLWNVAVMWGHPEDAVALGLALYALVFALDGRWTGAGWLFGAAMVTQPLVLLMFPVMVAFGGRNRILGFSVRQCSTRGRPHAHPVGFSVPRHGPRIARSAKLSGHRSRHALDDSCSRDLGVGTYPDRGCRPGPGGSPCIGLRIGLVGPAVASRARPDRVGDGDGAGPALFHRVRDGRFLRVAGTRRQSGGCRQHRTTSSVPRRRCRHLYDGCGPVAIGMAFVVDDRDRWHRGGSCGRHPIPPPTDH